LDDQDRQNLFAAAAVVVLVVLSLWLMHYWTEHRKLEDCYLSGRRNCEPVQADQ
jgi:hypothetical protein